MHYGNASFLVLFHSYFVFSTVQLPDGRHPHFGNTSDQEALIGFMSAITYDPSQSLPTTWKPNVSFCGWTDVICSRRSQRVVSLNVSSMGLQGIISPVLGNLWFLTILDTFGGCSSLQFFSMAINNLTGNIHSELCVLPNKLQFIALQVNSLTRTIRPAWETYPFWTVYI